MMMVMIDTRFQELMIVMRNDNGDGVDDGDDWFQELMIVMKNDDSDGIDDGDDKWW